MNLVGDWRYVYPGELQTFGSIENRKQAFHHTGFIGSYLTLLNMTTRVGSTVFCHGGITPHFSKNGIDWINDITHDSIIPYMESNGRQGDKYGVFGGEGPTWYRRYALDDEAVICDVLDQALELLEANRMVVGHTVQHDGEIHTRCGGKMILIDIGISNVYGGNKGSLEIRGNDVYALYADRIESLPSPPPYVPKDKREQLVHEEL